MIMFSLGLCFTVSAAPFPSSQDSTDDQVPPNQESTALTNPLWQTCSMAFTQYEIITETPITT
jgi:hypothetical protein